MKTDMQYNPDVLDALANLSNDEVFTPPAIVNDMLDLLPEDLRSDSTITILDPATKSWVFLREAAKRFIIWLKQEFPDLQQRLNHIYTKQLFGIAITELTWLLARRSLYCSKIANGKYSLCTSFEDMLWHIWMERTEHIRGRGKCIYCGASQDEYERDDLLETYAYKFIHSTPEDIPALFSSDPDMKFDVIIGNPPYQLSTWWSWRQAKPIYNKFVEQAKKMNPRYLSMIMPARWYSWGMGLWKFREEMLNDRRISTLVDFENSSEVFPWVDIAWWVCFFLRQKNYEWDCNVINKSKTWYTSSTRRLNEFNIFIRQEKAISVVHKISHLLEKWSVSDIVSPIKPFWMPTNYKPRKEWVPCRFIQKHWLKFANEKDVNDKYWIINNWKVLIPKAPIAWQTDFSKPIKIYHSKNAFIAKPWECCTESYIVIWWFESKSEALNFRSYLFTKVARFLILQTVISQDINKKNFRFVPILDFNKSYSDQDLIEMRWITDEEREYIDSKILETE